MAICTVTAPPHFDALLALMFSLIGTSQSVLPRRQRLSTATPQEATPKVALDQLIEARYRELIPAKHVSPPAFGMNLINCPGVREYLVNRFPGWESLHFIPKPHRQTLQIKSLLDHRGHLDNETTVQFPAFYSRASPLQIPIRRDVSLQFACWSLFEVPPSIKNQIPCATTCAVTLAADRLPRFVQDLSWPSFAFRSCNYPSNILCRSFFLLEEHLQALPLIPR